MLVRCEYIPRGKTGAELCPMLKFVGDCVGRAIPEGTYKVVHESITYAVQLQDMFEVENEDD